MPEEYNTQKDIDGMTLGGMDACIKSIWYHWEYITTEHRIELFRLYSELLNVQREIVFGKPPDQE